MSRPNRHADAGSATSEPLASHIAPLADALFVLLDNRDKDAAMGRQGRQRALDCFGWPSYLTRLSELYTRVLDERATRRTQVA